MNAGSGRSGEGSKRSDDLRSGSGGSSRSAWRQAHSIRRRLDRVNHTSSLVSYEERAQSAVPRAKAQRVRRRMHYAMSLQCFEATVTVGDRGTPNGGGAFDDDEGESDDSRGGAGTGSAGPFMCTPQSFPPTPVSRAHVMARTSQFADDILFLARDQLRLGENLKPGVDETVRRIKYCSSDMNVVSCVGVCPMCATCHRTWTSVGHAPTYLIVLVRVYYF